MRIGVDLMGSDTSPQDLFSAVALAVNVLPSTVTWEIYAPHSILSSLEFEASKRVVFYPSGESVTMEDNPQSAFRNKKDASLFLGIQRIRSQSIQGFVTAGNTGALILASALFLEKLPGIKRPALLAILPRITAPLVIVDAGGHISFKAHHFLQFAKMGAACLKTFYSKPIPRVGLLNIGQEMEKGHRELRLAWKLLSQETQEFSFVGNVEARALFSEAIDVLVTDGFTGNILIKAAEGVAAELLSHLKDKVPEPIFHSLSKAYDYTQHPGAIVGGVQGTVMKCHGEATPKSFFASLKGCYELCLSQNGSHT